MTFTSRANVLASCWIYRSTKEFRNIPDHFQAHLVFLVLAKDRVNFAQSRAMSACPRCFSIPCTSSLGGGSKASSLPRRKGGLVVGKKRWHTEGVLAILFFVLGLCCVDEHFPCKTPALTYTVVIRIVAGTVHFFSLIAVSSKLFL